MREKYDMRLTIHSELRDKILNAEKIQFNIDGKIHSLELDHENEGNQKISLRHFIFPSLLGTLLFFAFFYFNSDTTIPLTGRLSIASVTIIIGVLSGILTFGSYFIYGKRRGFANLETVYWRNFPTFMLSFVIILMMCMLFAFWILEQLFVGLTLDIY